jgi:putative endonuclease
MSGARRRALQLGADAEVRVTDALIAQGWAVLARNWKGGRGELDIVVQKKGHLRFVEVKARETYIAGVESLTNVKQKRLISAGEAWLTQFGEPETDVGFVLAVVAGTHSSSTIHWLDDPFDGS